MSFDVLAAFGALIGPLGAMAVIVLRIYQARVKKLEEENRELLGLLWEMSGENKVTREEIGRVLTRKREE